MVWAEHVCEQWARRPSRTCLCLPPVKWETFRKWVSSEIHINTYTDFEWKQLLQMVNIGHKKYHCFRVHLWTFSFASVGWKRGYLKMCWWGELLNKMFFLQQTQQRRTEVFPAACYWLLCWTTAYDCVETPVETWDKPSCCVAFVTGESPSFLAASPCQLPELVMRSMWVTFNGILDCIFSSWIIWDLLLISANFQVYFGGGSVCNFSTDRWHGWFFTVLVHANPGSQRVTRVV